MNNLKPTLKELLEAEELQREMVAAQHIKEVE